MLTPKGTNVHSIIFGDGGLEISYSEARDTDRETGVQEIRNLMIPGHLVDETLTEMLDDIDQLLGEVSVIRRQPPPTKKS